MDKKSLGRKPARHNHLAWSEDPPFLRKLYSLKTRQPHFATNDFPCFPAFLLEFFPIFLCYMKTLRSPRAFQLMQNRGNRFVRSGFIASGRKTRLIFIL
uniref:SFRICE_015354 n=1 Tax=Spodoptera frugiperda TaxID=7108 RepID=A0A2H1VGV1_SPOFR